MHAHYLDDHNLTGRPDLTAERLAGLGITYAAFPTEPAVYQAPLDELKVRNGYVQQDIVELAPTTPNLDTICAKFIEEHTHDDDEVRFVLSGEGIFDIRDDQDRWMRVQVCAGDLIVVPAGRNHRFLLTEAKHIRCVRLFKDAAGWVPNYRN